MAAAAYYGTFADVDSASASGSYRVSAKSDLFVTASQSRFDGKRSLGIFTGLSVAVEAQHCRHVDRAPGRKDGSRG